MSAFSFYKKNMQDIFELATLPFVPYSVFFKKSPGAPFDTIPFVKALVILATPSLFVFAAFTLTLGLIAAAIETILLPFQALYEIADETYNDCVSSPGF